jgi:CRP-like cAMP-binding protein
MDIGLARALWRTPCIVNVRGSNRLLALLSDEERERLLPCMQRVSLESGESIQEAGKPISYAYFPLSCALSLVVTTADGSQVETATVGNEGMVDVSLLMGANESAVDTFAQIPGEALRMRRAALDGELDAGGAFPDVMRRYGEAYLSQVAQSAACNRLHPVEQRLCRWLLATHDRVGLDHLPLTQEFIATMLGVRRSTVSITTAVLEKAGYIRHARGSIDVLDRAGLEQGSCECYSVVRNKLERVLCAPEAASRGGGLKAELTR